MPELRATNLTDRKVLALQATPSRYDVYDAKVRNLGIRVSPSGTKSWFVMPRVNGRPVRKTLGRYPALSLAEARIEAQSVLSKLAKGEIENEQRSAMFGNVVEEWFEKDQAGNRSVNDVKNAFQNRILPNLKNRQLDSIRKADISKILDKAMSDGVGTQANRLRAYLARFFAWCEERDYLDHNPAQAVPKPFKEQSRDRSLSFAELERVIKAAKGMGYPFGHIFLLLILTGQRRDEVGQMRWDEIDFTTGRWTIPANRSKNRKQHIVDLPGLALKILRDIPQIDDCPFVFTSTGKTPVSGYSKAKARLDACAQLTDWKLHDLRRTFATLATEELGAPPVVVDKILNHQSGAVRGIAAVYQRGQYLAERKRVLEEWACVLESETNGNT